MKWLTAEAKQRLSEVLRRSESEPQEIFNRKRLVAAVISAEEYERYRRWRESTERRSLAEALSEVRELCSEHDYELEVPLRQDRATWADQPER